MSALLLQDLRKTYRNGFEALKCIDLEVAPGDFFALLGPNGAGKSTAIGIVSSLVTKSSGRVEVFGQDLDRNPEGVKSAIGLVPQEFNFNQWEPVAEIVVNQAGFYGIPRKLAWERANTWLSQHGNPYKLTVMDLDGRVGIDYGVYGVPETYVIDKAGIIRMKHTGPITADALSHTILPLLAELSK